MNGLCVRLHLFPIGAIHGHHRLRIEAAQLAGADLVCLELAPGLEQFAARDAFARGVLVVALGIPALAVFTGEELDQLDRLGGLLAGRGDAGAADIDMGAPAGLVRSILVRPEDTDLLRRAALPVILLVDTYVCVCASKAVVIF